MPSPVFSVIVPIYNRANTISKCLDSILGQTFGDFEVILVDNNSTDHLADVLREYSDPRIKITHCSTPGPSAARMQGVGLSSGKFLSFIDSDDVWRHDVLEQVVSRMEAADPPLAIYLSPVIFKSDIPIDWNAKPKSDVIVADHLLDALWKGAPGACALAGVQRELFVNGQGFAEELWVGEDVDWALRHASAGPVCLLLDEPRLGYRRHEENITKDSRRYEAWASELLEFAHTGRYATSSNPDLCVFIVKHLIGQLQTILRMRSFWSFLRLYPQVFALGVRWWIIQPLCMPTLFAAYFRKRTKTIPAP